MPKAVLVVHTEPASVELESAYKEWYDDIHVPDVLALPGIVAATRYKVADAQVVRGTPDIPSYVTMYEIEADDLLAMVKSFNAAFASGALRMENAPTGARSSIVLYQEASPRRSG